MTRTRIAVFAVLLGMTLAAAAQTHAPSTPAERDRIVKLSEKLQANPLDPRLASERAWAMKWISDVPDITVDICEPVYKPMMDARHGNELAQVFTIAATAFIVQHPDKSELDVAVNTAAMEAMLKAYQAMIAKSPRLRSPELDDLLDTRDTGGLEKYVTEATIKCSNNPKS